MSTSFTFAPAESGPTAPAATPAEGDRPSWLPENFQSPEDLAKSYQESQAKLTQQAQELAALKKGTPAPEENPTETQPTPGEGDQEGEAAQRVADAAGFDLSSYQTEFDTSGDVGEDSRAKIADGLKNVLGPDARQIVDQFIEGRKATLANDAAMYYDAAGGQEQYAAMIEWAKQALPAEQCHAYDRQVTSGDRHSATLAIQGMRAAYEKANGRVPNLLPGRGGVPTGTQGFKSSAEMQAAMQDPRYRSDPAYRDSVAAKLKVSNF